MQTSFFKQYATACFLGILLTSCQSDTPSTTDKPTLSETEVALEVLTTKDEQGRVMQEYQLDKIRQTKHGFDKLYYPNGKLARESTYRFGVVEGKEISYYENGQVESEITFIQGRREGAFKYFHPNGSIKQEGTYKHDGIDGECKTYYDNGKIREVVTMKDGFENGAFKEYARNSGVLAAEGIYKVDGEGIAREHGLLVIYDSISGAPSRKMDCDMGRCYTTWTADKGSVTPKKLQ